MTISSSINKAQYTANGATTVFAFNFLIPSSQDIQVFLNDALQSSGFTVSGYGNPAGGSVTFTTAPQNLWIVTILRVMPLTQAVDYVPYDAFPAQTHEGALDKLTMIDQQQQEEIDRSLKISVSAPDTNVIIDAPVDEAILTWELGVPGTSRIKNGASIQQIEQDVESANNAAISAVQSAASAGASASAAAASAAAAEEAANNLTANKYEETTTVVKSVFTIPFAISTMAPNVMIMVNGVVQPPSAYTITNSTTITLDEAVPIGTNFFLAAAAPPTLPNFTDIVRTSAPATLGQDLIFNGQGLWVPTHPRHKNFFINGGMNVQQRAELSGLTDTNIRYGKADRWCVQVAATGISYALTAGAFGGVATGQALYITGLSMTGYTRITQRIESLDCQPLTNKRVTISGTCYHDFGYTVPFGIVLEKPTAKDNFASVTTIQNGPGVDVPSGVPTKVTFTVFLAENAKDGLQVSFQPYESKTVTGKTVALAEAQLEIGDIMTPFEFRPYGLELALCQRFYVQYTSVDLMGRAASPTSCSFTAWTPVPLRKDPTVSMFQGIVKYDGTGVAPGTVQFSGRSHNSIRIGVSGIAVTDNAMYWNNIIANQFLTLDAEL
jgi:hypothetical protein